MLTSVLSGKSVFQRFDRMLGRRSLKVNPRNPASETCCKDFRVAMGFKYSFDAKIDKPVA